MSRSFVTFNDFTRVAIFFYKTIGIEPNPAVGVNARSNLWRYLYFILNIIDLNFVVILEIIFILQMFKYNIMEGTKTLSYIGFVTVSELKIFTIFLQRTKITELMRQLESIFPSQQPEEQRQYRVQYYLRRCRLVVNGYGGLFMILIITYNSFGILSYVVRRWWLHMPDAEMMKPFVPWNWYNNWSYYLMYGLQAFAGYTVTTGHVSCDLLINAIVIQLIMHFDHLARSIEEYQIKAKRMPDGFNKDLQCLQQMIICHNKLLELSEVINTVFGIPLFLNFFISSMVVCLTGFLISIGVPFEMTLVMMLFMGSCFVQIYLISHFSQLLIDASGSVALAIYKMDWSEADVRYRRMLIFVAQRAQKPVSLRATIFMNVSKVTMTEFMQMSYKFFALLRTIYRQ